ncbi:monooxygenase [Sphaerisporangium siamense]|uniref:2-polyprenyl-6-methoxyphenol hydroxylase-like FAD-dependent oxidoreductase n=1 Tax=Sphaerisporangium siamense TaxID=795645 RepID=A0A7W7G865_9ACTN|nr:flavin-dependent oxidoreductase [Sphaerisporangium siamense]MBB4701408.1 2-polyprenyl-6-methoxyphenol hydroxylase-like FAD-dependent oxidoreductase [Sphaerisporangium siamense]GII85531.1 monooxygenase [Sphaerisporangium siamense]
MATKTRAVVLGAGIGGLTLALELHRAGIECVVLEAAPSLAALGVGINLLPHATRNLARLGLEPALAEVAVTTRESAFFNRFGQLIAREPAGRHAGYDWPQFSIHRGDLQQVLLAAVHERLGPDAVLLGHRATHVTQDDRSATAHVRHPDGSSSTVRGDVVVGADGVHSVVRAQFHSGAAPRYTGYMMWRGTTVWPRFLTGASMVRAGWLATGKMVIYPIRDRVNARGDQLVNWVAEVEGPIRDVRDWNRPGLVEDFIAPFEDWRFDWLDVPAMIRAADEVLEYPMVDQDPLPHWGEGRVTLLGDAAHPMVPRGSNGAAQAILDARVLAERLAAGDPCRALRAYEAERVPATSQVVLTNRANPPDALLREVYERTGDRPFARIEDVITPEEIRRIGEGYQAVAGYSRTALT